MRTIVQDPSPVLRQIATPIVKEEFGSLSLDEIITDMIEALESQHDGVAIAAPQIGVSKRIFIISKKAMKGWREHKIFINPTFIRIGKAKKSLTEGCLSVRHKYGTTIRSDTATVRAQNRKGHEFQLSGRGLVAQIFQHEVDHLNGILFIDSATGVEDIPPTPSHATNAA